MTTPPTLPSGFPRFGCDSSCLMRSKIASDAALNVEKISSRRAFVIMTLAIFCVTPKWPRQCLLNQNRRKDNAITSFSWLPRTCAEEYHRNSRPTFQGFEASLSSLRSLKWSLPYLAIEAMEYINIMESISPGGHLMFLLKRGILTKNYLSTKVK